MVIRQKRGNPSTVFLLGTTAAHDQFFLPTRDEAVSQALAYAKQQHVRIWEMLCHSRQGRAAIVESVDLRLIELGREVRENESWLFGSE